MSLTIQASRLDVPFKESTSKYKPKVYKWNNKTFDTKYKELLEVKILESNIQTKLKIVTLTGDEAYLHILAKS